MAIDMDRLQTFLGKVVGDFGGAMSASLVLIGDKLGLYKAMAAAGPAGVTPEELAKSTGTAERYIREWLLNQAAGGYCEYDAARKRYVLPPEQAAALAEDDSPANIVGGFQIAASMVKDEARLSKAFKTGEGVDWGQHDHDLFHGTERFFSANYRGNLVANWIPALEGMKARLEAGANVADIGCGHGASTVIMAKAFPKSKFWGYDTHGPSIDRAKQMSIQQRVSDRCHFEVGSGATFHPPAGTKFDLICFFDCLHDMGDPVAAMRHARVCVKPDGAVMIVEPFANDKVEDNLNPVGRVFSAASTMICVAHSLAHHGPALGAQAGEARLAAVAKEGGFSKVRRATQTPFNLILEAKI